LHPDLLITDLIMPDMNGKELSEKIREKIPDIHILYSSGYTDNHLIHSGELDTTIDFLQKPYSVIQLLKKVRKILNR
jgi:YesN/AraC family two-component response regulator